MAWSLMSSLALRNRNTLALSPMGSLPQARWDLSCSDPAGSFLSWAFVPPSISQEDCHLLPRHSGGAGRSLFWTTQPSPYRPCLLLSEAP